MSSRLFRAIVGVGISLGGAACFGTVVDAPDASEAAEGETSSPDGAGPAADAGTDGATPTEDAGVVDARGDVDAASDAPRDVILDAFCDAAWPTTKGNAGPTCGPVTACAEAGPPPRCYAQIDPLVCVSGPHVPAYCVAGRWACSTGAVPEELCKCWGLPDAAPSCPP